MRKKKKIIKGISNAKGATNFRTQLYEVDEDMTIIFQETHKRKINEITYKVYDKVVINIKVNNNECAIYSQEYCPADLRKKEGKKADITLILLDRRESIGDMYLGEVKHTLNEEGILKTCEQLRAGLYYVNNLIINDLKNFKIEQHIMSITANFDEDKIKRIIQKYEKQIQDVKENKGESLAVKKMQVYDNNNKIQKCKILKDFLEYKFLHKDNKYYNFEVIKLEPSLEGEYKAELKVSL